MTDLTQALAQASLNHDVQAARDPYPDEILLRGNLCKLGAKMKTWRDRWVAVWGDSVLRYYKAAPAPGKNPKELRPQGEINLRRDVVELLSYEHCTAFMNAEKGSFMNVTQPMRWPVQANERNAFAIRTTYRIFYMFTAHGDASYWIKGLATLCTGSDSFLGIDVSNPPLPSSGTIARSASVARSTHSTPPTSLTSSRAHSPRHSSSASPRSVTPTAEERRMTSAT
jgi:hypothetical protein